MAFKRLPRFRRAPEFPPIHLTHRDREIIWLVHKHRFLRSSHLVNLVGGSRPKILRRLQRLFHTGYLERPRAQIDYYHQNGSKPIIYGLGHNGAAVMKRTGGASFHELDWGSKNRTVGRIFLEHALLVSDVLVALELASRKSGRIRLLVGKQISIPSDTALKRNPFQWRVKLPNRGYISVRPDAVFALEYLDRPLRRQLDYYFLEADRGTMPVIRKGIGQSSAQRKFLAYQATWKQNVHRSRFEFPSFRVLVVTEHAKRLDALKQGRAQLQSGQTLFRLFDAQTFAQDPLVAIGQ